MSKKEKITKKSANKLNMAFSILLVLALAISVKLSINAHIKAVKQARIEACLDTKLKLHEMGADSLIIHSFACADL